MTHELGTFSRLAASDRTTTMTTRRLPALLALFTTLAFAAPAFDMNESAIEAYILNDEPHDPDLAAAAPILADPAFKLGEVYSYPNPARSGKNPTIHIESGIADYLDIRIYDVSGEKVHEARIDSPPKIINDKYAYEYTWNTSGIPSGVYIYILIANKQGEKDIRVMKKLGLVK